VKLKVRRFWKSGRNVSGILWSCSVKLSNESAIFFLMKAKIDTMISSLGSMSRSVYLRIARCFNPENNRSLEINCRASCDSGVSPGS